MWIRVAIALLGALLLVAIPARSQLIGEGVWKTVPVSFQGPGDIVGSAVFYWSCTIAYTAAYAAAHSSACALQRTSDSATCTMNFATNGVADTTVGTPCAGATVASFCNATTCNVTGMSDQTGNGWTASSVLGPPTLGFNTLGTCPSVFFTNSGQGGERNLGITANPQPFTGVAIINLSTTTGTGGDLTWSQNMTANTVTGNFTVNPGTPLNAAFTTGTRYAFIGVANGTSSSININGPQTTGGAGAGGQSGGELGRSFDADIMIGAGWNIAFSGGQITSMNTKLRSYCGGF
jgi:hypothetical protein